MAATLMVEGVAYATPTGIYIWALPVLLSLFVSRLVFTTVHRLSISTVVPDRKDPDTTLVAWCTQKTV
jgi:hypothetical protein